MYATSVIKIRQLAALTLVSLLMSQKGVAGVNNNEARFSGGSVSSPAIGATGVLDTTSTEQLSFRYKAGKAKDVGKYSAGEVDVPYSKITRLTYGDTEHLRVGETVALTALAGVGGLLLLLSKSHTHYLAITYTDVKEQSQVVNFEVGKDAIRPAMDSLELRTGKKVEFEAGPTPSKGKP